MGGGIRGRLVVLGKPCSLDVELRGTIESRRPEHQGLETAFHDLITKSTAHTQAVPVVHHSYGMKNSNRAS